MKNKNYSATNISGFYKNFLLAFIISGCFYATDSNAQVATGYIFSQSNGTYTPITGGTVIATATGTGTSTDASLDQGNYSGNIGFTFNFNGTNYTTFNVNGNGYITFGATLPLTSLTTPISSTTAYSGAVAALARDIWGVYGSIGTRTLNSAVITAVTDFTGIANGKALRGTGIPAGATVSSFNIGAGTITMSAVATSTSTNTWIGWPNGEIRVETIGSAPNRICVIQFSGMSDFVTSGTNGNNMTWQIQLAEGGGLSVNQSISIVYGPMTNLLTTSRTQQVGLRGATNADFNNRTSTTTWSGTTAGTLNTSTVTRTNTNFPASGLTFTWTPPNVCTGTPVPGTASTNTSNVCLGNTATLNVAGFPTGTTGITLQWQQSSVPGGPYADVTGGIGATAATYTTPGLTANTYYVCKVTCTNSTLFALSNEVAISVNDPQVASTTDATICGIGTATLSAVPSAGASINWYAAQTGGSPLATGNSFTTPVISSTTNYWAAATSGGVTENMSTPNIGTSVFISQAIGWGLRFTVNTAATINHVTIKAANTTAGTATMQIKISDLSDNVLYTAALHSFAVTTSLAEYIIPVNINVPPGNYKMGMTSTGIDDLVRESGGVTFPYNTSSNAISITAGANGTGTAQTTSSYYWFYRWNISTGCESVRTMVTANVTSAPATISATATQALVCSGGSTTLNVSSANDPNYIYTWTPGNLTGNSVVVSPATTTDYTVTAVDNSVANNGCTQIATVTITAQPASASVSSSPEAFCVTGGSAVLSLIPSTGYPANSIQWQNSPDNNTFSDIAGANSATYITPVISADTYYKALIKDGNNNVCLQPSYSLVINNPQLTGTTPASRCGIGTVTLGAATANGNNINWYAAATGGVPIGTGTSFTTPVINSTIDFYAAAASAGSSSANVGLPAAITSTNTGVGTTNFGQVFNVFSAFTLNTVTIYPVSSTSASGTVTIDVINGSGTVMHSAVVSVTGSPSGSVIPRTVTLNFNIAPGTNYKLRPRSFSGISSLLFEPSSAAPGGNYGYPFTVPGVVSILTSTLTAAPTNTARNDLYYYFYNWSISTGCESPRVPVTATVTEPPAIVAQTTSAAICPSQTADVSVSSPTNDPNYTYTWTSNPAGFTATGPGPHTVSPVVTTEYIVNAVDNSSGPNAGCADVTSVTVVAGASGGTVTSSVSQICISGTPALTVTGAGGGPIQWQESTTGLAGSWINVGAGGTTYTPASPITQTMYYQVVVSCGVIPVFSNMVTVTVNNPAIATTTPATRCGTGTVGLSATTTVPSNVVNWYNVPTGGTPLPGGSGVASGGTFTTPVISSNTTFYAAATSAGGGIQNIGAPNLSIGAFTTLAGHFLNFTVLAPTTIQSVECFFDGVGESFNLNIRNASTLASVFTYAGITTVSGTSTPQVLPINATLAPGNYQMGWLTNPGVYRNSTGGSYPYTIPGVLSITGNSFDPDYYYYFYHWAVASGCEGAVRVPVLATVTPAPVITVTSQNDLTCPGASTLVSVSSPNDPNYTYSWTSTPAGFTATGPGPHTVTPAVTTTYSVSAIDNTSGPNTGCAAFSSVTVKSANSYCAAVGNTGTCITNVALNTLDNTTGCQPGTPFYSFQSATTTLNDGFTYALGVTVNSDIYGGGIVSVWFDWNKDGVFSPSEWYQPFTSGLTGSMYVTVPIGISGNVVMRVRSRGVGNPNGSGDACITMASGETEDYCINVIAAPAIPPACVVNTLPAEAASITCPTGSTTLSWATGPGGGFPTGYNVYFGTTSNPPAAPTNPQTALTFVPGALAPGTYYWRIEPFNTHGTTSSCTVNSFTVPTPAVGTLTLSSPFGCGTQSNVVIDISGGYTGALTIEFESPAGSNNWLPVQDANTGLNATSVPTVAVVALPLGDLLTRGFRAVVTDCQNNKIYTNIVVFTQNNPAPPVAVASVVSGCIGDQATASVTVPSGIQVNWYSAATGGTLLQSNSLSYTAPVTVNATYYAAAFNPVTGCEGLVRTAVQVTANAKPIVNLTNSNPTICNPGAVPNNSLLSANVSNASSTNIAFSSSGAIIIPATGTGATTGAPSNPYPSSINVSGLTPAAAVQNVVVSGLTHTFPGDIDMVLVSPTGVRVILMSDRGAGTDVSGITLTIQDGAPVMPTALVTGTFAPSNTTTPDAFPAPGPGSVTQATPALASFIGDPNGTWSLYVVDDAGGDIGSIASWTINFVDGTAFSYAWTVNAAPLANGSVPGNTPTTLTVNPVASATPYQYEVVMTNQTTGCSSSANTSLQVNRSPLVVSLQSATLNGNAVTAFPSLPSILDIPVFTETGSCDKVVSYNVDITGVPDPDEVAGAVNYTFTGATLGSGPGTGTGSAFGRLIPTGRTTINVNAANVCGNQSRTFRVTVTDNVPPVIIPIQVAPSNTNGGECASNVQVTQPDLTNGGLFDNCPNASLIFVGRSDGRSQFEQYFAGTTTVTWQATDASANTSTATQDVVVNNTKPVITSFTTSSSLIFVNQTATFTTEFTDDDGGGTHTVKFYRDKNDAVPANVKTLAPVCYNACTGIATYNVTSDPILYTTSEVAEPKVEVLDGCNLAADQNPGVTTIMYLAVAVPGQQFTTAGGHFTIPAGAHPASYEGFNVSIGNIVKKATTGNSFKGQMEMNVHIPGLPDWRVHTDNGSNTDITWDYLTIAGCSLATFKGSIRVNGQTGYKVLVQQSDKDRNPATSNFIRVKVTTNGGALIFDTQPGLTEALTSGNGGAAAIITALDNGSVKVQPSNTQNQACTSRIEGDALEGDVLMNLPNPFTGQTEIRFSVPQDGLYTLKVYNYLGQEVATPFNGEAVSGSLYSVMFDGSNLDAGIYTYHLTGTALNETRRMNLVK